MKLRRLLKKLRPASSVGHVAGFDEDYYRRWYPDVEQFGGTPLQHYLQHGWREGRDPSASFSTAGYLAANPDVEASEVNPLVHFTEFGSSENRNGWQKPKLSPTIIPLDDEDKRGPPQFDRSNDCLIFMYWVSADKPEPPSAVAWKSFYPNFRVFSDIDVIPLLPPSFVALYNSIRLPAAKSDIARMFLLREYGGLYIDAHVGPASLSNLLETLDKLADYDVVLFGKGWEMETSADFNLMNTVIAAQRGAHELDLMIDVIVSNVVNQKSQEVSAADLVPYNLFYLTGTYILIQVLFDQVQPRPQLKSEFMDRVFMHFMKNNIDSGFQLYCYYNYRAPSSHWSERQNNERFFLDCA